MSGAILQLFSYFAQGTSPAISSDIAHIFRCLQPEYYAIETSRTRIYLRSKTNVSVSLIRRCSHNPSKNLCWKWPFGSDCVQSYSG